MNAVEGPRNRPSSKDEKEEPIPISKPSLPIKLVQTITCDQGAIRAVRFNVDGNYCLTCGSDKSIKLWNGPKNMLIKKYTGHGYDVLDVAGSSDNCQLASCGSDKTVIYWDVGTGQIIRRYRGHAGRVNCVEFNEESTLIMSGSVDSSVRAWDCRSRKSAPVQIMDEAKDSISSVQDLERVAGLGQVLLGWVNTRIKNGVKSLSDDRMKRRMPWVTDHEILSSSIDGRVRRYDLRIGSLFTDYIGSAVTCAKFTKDGQCILSSSHDNTLRLLDISTGEMLGEYVGHNNSKYMIECGLNRKDDHVLSGSEDGSIYMWDLIDANVKEKVIVQKNKVIHSISHHPNDDILLAACEDKVYLFADELYEIPD